MARRVGSSVRIPARRFEGVDADVLRTRWRRPDLHLFETVDSTNDLARELAEAGAPHGTLVLADAQSAGRGRGDRPWFSPPGAGLYFSLVLRPDRRVHPTLLPVLAGLGVVRALDRVAPDAEPALKWPNDVLLRGRKAGGILAEGAWEGPVPRYVVVGVGLNVHTRPQDFPAEWRETATSVDAARGRPTDRLELMDALLAELDRVLDRPGTTMESDALRDLDAYDWLRDRRCVVTEPGREEGVEGVATGIAPDGALLFRPDAGPLRRVLAGTVRALPAGRGRP